MGHPGTASGHQQDGPALSLPFPGVCGGQAPPPAKPGSVTSPPPQLRREKQRYPSHGPQLHTKPPTGPRRLQASLIPLPVLREQRPALPCLPLPPPGEAPLKGSDKPEEKGKPCACERPRPQAGPSARGTLSPQKNRLCCLRGEESGWGILTPGSGRTGTSSGRTRGLESGILAACGRAAASEGRPLPSGLGPAAAGRARARSRARPIQPRPIPPAPPRRPPPPPTPTPPLRPRVRSALSRRRTRSDMENLPPK